jgi:hypothetical protein
MNNNKISKDLFLKCYYEMKNLQECLYYFNEHYYCKKYITEFYDCIGDKI